MIEASIGGPQFQTNIQLVLHPLNSAPTLLFRDVYGLEFQGSWNSMFSATFPVPLHCTSSCHLSSTGELKRVF